jgi:aspartate/methionine/tyrosine aminotransferase
VRPGELNAILEAEHPVARRLLSPLGERAALPHGIPQQTAEARGAARQATIGQLTDGAGRPLALPSLAAQVDARDRDHAMLYAPQHGLLALRQAWAAAHGLPELPVVTCGITHAISLAVDLFCSPAAPLVAAAPCWDNYEVIATMRTGAPVVSYPFYGADGRFNLDGLLSTLDRVAGPALVLLNFPSNPSGYAPMADEGRRIVEALASRPGPLAVLCDDAYHPLYFEPGMYGDSLFHALAASADPSRLLVLKACGATKELVFFGGRVGFLSTSAQGKANEALAEKAAAVLRGTISSVSAPAQYAVLRALQSPTLAAEQAQVRGTLATRYQALRQAMQRHGLESFPFNSGCFAMLPVPLGQDADTLRRRLVAERSVGVIAVHGANALRLAFCSVEAEDMDDLVARVAPLLA